MTSPLVTSAVANAPAAQMIVTAAMETFAVRSGESHRLRDVVAALADVAGRPLPIVWGGRPYRDREVMIPWVNNVPVPGWRPLISLREGLASVLWADGYDAPRDQVSIAQQSVPK